VRAHGRLGLSEHLQKLGSCGSGEQEDAMKAMTRSVYGSADVLELIDVETPAAADDEVLLRVHAAGVGPEVWHLMTGLPYLVRIMGFGLRKPKNPILGMDVAGVVETVGKDVTQVRPGDAVFGTCVGSFAEYACARADKIAPKSASLTFEQAAVLPTSGCTALQGLRDVGRIESGQSVLIIGASGGVGTFAVQLAKAFGAEVTGVCRTDAIELVRSIGADRVIDYSREDFADGVRRYDLILDTAGRRSLTHLRRALTPRGTLVIVGGEGGGKWTGGFERQILRANLLSLAVRQRLRPLTSTARREDLLELTALVEAGKLTPVINKACALSQAATVLSDADEGHGRGKVVVTI
jgi:NADPH:quinone reductase-like Zn-dependent oxidoreductase